MLMVVSQRKYTALVSSLRARQESPSSDTRAGKPERVTEHHGLHAQSRLVRQPASPSELFCRPGARIHNKQACILSGVAGIISFDLYPFGGLR